MQAFLSVIKKTALYFGACGFLGVLFLTSCGFGTDQGSAFDSLTDSENQEEDAGGEGSSSQALSHELCEEHKTCRMACQRIYHQVHAQLHCEALTVGEVSSLQKLFKALTTLDPLEQENLLSQSPAGVWDLYLQAGLSGLTNHLSGLLDFYPHSQKNYRNILRRITSDKELTLVLKDNDLHHEVLKQFLLGAVYPPSLRKRSLTQNLPPADGEEDHPTPFCPPLSSLQDCQMDETSHLCGCRSNDLYLNKGVLSYKLSTVQNPKTLSTIPPENQDLLVALSFTAPTHQNPAQSPAPAPSSSEENHPPPSQSTQGFNLFLFTSSDPARFPAFSLAHSLLEEACGQQQTKGAKPLAEGTKPQAEGAKSRATGDHSHFMKQQQCIAGFYCWLKGLKASPLHQLLNSPQVDSLFSREALSLIRGERLNSPSDDCKGF